MLREPKSAGYRVSHYTRYVKRRFVAREASRIRDSGSKPKTKTNMHLKNEKRKGEEFIWISVVYVICDPRKSLSVDGNFDVSHIEEIRT
jgi:hypothetical protein